MQMHKQTRIEELQTRNESFRAANISGGLKTPPAASRQKGVEIRAQVLMMKEARIARQQSRALGTERGQSQERSVQIRQG